MCETALFLGKSDQNTELQEMTEKSQQLSLSETQQVGTFIGILCESLKNKIWLSLCWTIKQIY